MKFNKDFVTKETRDNEFFVIVDNTGFPDSRQLLEGKEDSVSAKVLISEHLEAGPAKDGDLHIIVTMTTEFVAEEEYFMLVIIVSFVCLALIFLLIGLVIKFRLQKREYKRITYEQNILRRRGSPDQVRLTETERALLVGATPKASNFQVNLLASGGSLAQ